MTPQPENSFDRLTDAVSRRRLTPDELKGFGRVLPAALPAVRPVFKVQAPSREEGRKGWSVVIGLKGEF